MDRAHCINTISAITLFVAASWAAPAIAQVVIEGSEATTTIEVAGGDDDSGDGAETTEGDGDGDSDADPGGNDSDALTEVSIEGEDTSDSFADLDFSGSNAPLADAHRDQLEKTLDPAVQRQVAKCATADTITHKKGFGGTVRFDFSVTESGAISAADVEVDGLEKSFHDPASGATNEVLDAFVKDQTERVRACLASVTARTESLGRPAKISLTYNLAWKKGPTASRAR